MPELKLTPQQVEIMKSRVAREVAVLELVQWARRASDELNAIAKLFGVDSASAIYVRKAIKAVEDAEK